MEERWKDTPTMRESVEYNLMVAQAAMDYYEARKVLTQVASTLRYQATKKTTDENTKSRLKETVKNIEGFLQEHRS